MMLKLYKVFYEALYVSSTGYAALTKFSSSTSREKVTTVCFNHNRELSLCWLRCALGSGSGDAEAFEPLVELHHSFHLVQDQDPAGADFQNEVHFQVED